MGQRCSVPRDVPVVARYTASALFETAAYGERFVVIGDTQYVLFDFRPGTTGPCIARTLYIHFMHRTLPDVLLLNRELSCDVPHELTYWLDGIVGVEAHREYHVVRLVGSVGIVDRDGLPRTVYGRLTLKHPDDSYDLFGGDRPDERISTDLYRVYTPKRFTGGCPHEYYAKRILLLSPASVIIDTPALRVLEAMAPLLPGYRVEYRPMSETTLWRRL